MVVSSNREPLLLTGNECVGMAEAAPLSMRVELLQDLSLPSQPRDRSRPLVEILGGEGIESGSRVGLIGWKVFDDRSRLDAPAFVVDDLRDLVDPSGTVDNAANLLMDAAN